MQEIVFNLQDFVLGAGAWAPVVYIFLMITAIVISPIPSSPLAIFSGTVFGIWEGMFWTMIGSVIGATIAFYIARIFGRPLILKLVPKKRLDNIEKRFSEGNLVVVIFLLRLVPLPFFDAVSYAAGLTKVSFKGFFVSTVLGLIPLVFIFSYTGDVFAGHFFTASIPIVVLSIVFLIFASIWYKKH